MTRWLDDTEDRAWRGYRWMHTLLNSRIVKDLGSDSDLSDSDYDVLSTLSEADDHSWRSSELAHRLRWSTSRLAHQVGRMQRRGLVARSRRVDDRRGATVALTDEGWATLRRAAPLHVDSVRRHFIDLLTDAELRALAKIAGKVVAHLEDAERVERGVDV